MVQVLDRTCCCMLSLRFTLIFFIRLYSPDLPVAVSWQILRVADLKKEEEGRSSGCRGLFWSFKWAVNVLEPDEEAANSWPVPRVKPHYLQVVTCVCVEEGTVPPDNTTSCWWPLTFKILLALEKGRERSSVAAIWTWSTRTTVRRMRRGAGGQPQTSLDHLKVVQNGHYVLRHEDVAGVNGHAGDRDQQGVWVGASRRRCGDEGLHKNLPTEDQID